MKGAPWIVPKEILVEHGVEGEIDEELARLVKEFEREMSRKMKRQSKTNEEEKPKKRRKKGDEKEKEMAKKREELRRAYRIKLNHMLPMDDISLLYLQERKDEVISFPAVSPYDYPIPQVLFLFFFLIFNLYSLTLQFLSVYFFSLPSFLTFFPFHSHSPLTEITP